MDAMVVDPETISAIFYGNDWHAITLGTARVDPVVLDGQADYSGDFLTYVSADGSHINRIRLSAVLAFAHRKDNQVDEWGREVTLS